MVGLRWSLHKETFLSSPNVKVVYYWSGLSCPPPGDRPKAGNEPESFMSPALAGRFFITSATWEVHYFYTPRNAHLKGYLDNLQKRPDSSWWACCFEPWAQVSAPPCDPAACQAVPTQVLRSNRMLRCSTKHCPPRKCSWGWIILQPTAQQGQMWASGWPLPSVPLEETP